MKRSIAKLKRRVGILVVKAKRANYTMRQLKDEEQKTLESRLFLAIRNLEKLKGKIVEHSKMKRLCYDIAKDKEKLQKELTDCMKVRYLYEDHAELIKKELYNKLKSKNDDLANYKNEVLKLSKICLQNQATIKFQKDQLERNMQEQQNSEEKTEKRYLNEKRKSLALQEKVIEKHNKYIALKKEVELLKKELEKSKNDKSEETFKKQHQEKIALREEIASLKVKLEKWQSKFNPVIIG